MKWLKIIGYGLLVWIFIFVLVSIFIGFKFTNRYVVNGAVYVLIIAAGFILGRKITVKGWGEAAVVGLLWVLGGLVLDLIITVRFTGYEIFKEWMMWLGYAILFVVAILGTKKETTSIIQN